MIKTLTIEGKEVGFKATALTPTIYQSLNKSDIYDDFPLLQDSILKNQKVTGEARNIIEKLAYTMAYQNDKEIGTMEEWLDQFENPMFAADIAVAIMSMWIGNSATSVESKKK